MVDSSDREALQVEASTRTSRAIPRVGSRVVVSNGSRPVIGTLRFAGNVDFTRSPVLGVELDDPLGKNDGSVNGRRYFQYNPNYGIFVHPNAVSKLDGPRAQDAALELRGRETVKLQSELEALRQLEAKLAAYPSQAEFSAYLASMKSDSDRPKKSRVDPSGRRRSSGRKKKESRRTANTKQSLRNGDACDQGDNLLRSVALRQRDQGMTVLHASTYFSHATSTLAPLWETIGKPTERQLTHVDAWLKEKGANNVLDIIRFGLVGDFLSALPWRPVEKLKLEDFFNDYEDAQEAIGYVDCVNMLVWMCQQELEKSYSIPRSTTREQEEERKKKIRKQHYPGEEMLITMSRKLRAAAYDKGGTNWTTLFKLYDRDNSGRIDFYEFKSLLRKDGKITPEMVPDDTIRAFFEYIDRDGSNTITLPEFVKWHESLAAGTTPSSPASSRMQSLSAPRSPRSPRSGSPRSTSRPLKKTMDLSTSAQDVASQVKRKSKQKLSVDLSPEMLEQLAHEREAEELQSVRDTANAHVQALLCVLAEFADSLRERIIRAREIAGDAFKRVSLAKTVAKITDDTKNCLPLPDALAKRLKRMEDIVAATARATQHASKKLDRVDPLLLVEEAKREANATKIQALCRGVKVRTHDVRAKLRNRGLKATAVDVGVDIAKSFSAADTETVVKLQAATRGFLSRRVHKKLMRAGLSAEEAEGATMEIFDMIGFQDTGKINIMKVQTPHIERLRRRFMNLLPAKQKTHSRVKEVDEKKQKWAKVWTDSFLNQSALAVGSAQKLQGLGMPFFMRSMQQVHHNLTKRQTAALWDGYTSGTRAVAISKEIFCDMVEAVAIGPDAAGEFVGITGEEFEALGAPRTRLDIALKFIEAVVVARLCKDGASIAEAREAIDSQMQLNRRSVVVGSKRLRRTFVATQYKLWCNQVEALTQTLHASGLDLDVAREAAVATKGNFYTMMHGKQETVVNSSSYSKYQVSQIIKLQANARGCLTRAYVSKFIKNWLAPGALKMRGDRQSRSVPAPLSRQMAPARRVDRDGVFQFAGYSGAPSQNFDQSKIVTLQAHTRGYLTRKHLDDGTILKTQSVSPQPDGMNKAPKSRVAGVPWRKLSFTKAEDTRNLVKIQAVSRGYLARKSLQKQATRSYRPQNQPENSYNVTCVVKLLKFKRSAFGFEEQVRLEVAAAEAVAAHHDSVGITDVRERIEGQTEIGVSMLAKTPEEAMAIAKKLLVADTMACDSQDAEFFEPQVIANVRCFGPDGNKLPWQDIHSVKTNFVRSRTASSASPISRDDEDVDDYDGDDYDDEDALKSQNSEAESEPVLPGCEYTITLDRSEGEGLGMKLLASDGFVENVKYPGLAMLWNIDHEQRSITRGDKLVEVNGIRDLKQMLEQLQEKRPLKITLKRKGDPDSEPVLPGREYTITLDRSEGEGLGMKISASDGFVENVKYPGLAMLWNIDHEQRSITRGDKLVEVNGIRDLKQMLEQLQQKQPLKVTFKRKGGLDSDSDQISMGDAVVDRITSRRSTVIRMQGDQALLKMDDDGKEEWAPLKSIEKVPKLNLAFAQQLRQDDLSAPTSRRVEAPPMHKRTQNSGAEEENRIRTSRQTLLVGFEPKGNKRLDDLKNTRLDDPQNARLDDLRKRARDKLARAARDGELQTAVDKLAGPAKIRQQHVDNLRAKAMANLFQAHREGKFKKALDKTDRIDDLRTRAKSNLSKTLSDGSLRQAFHKQATRDRLQGSSEGTEVDASTKDGDMGNSFSVRRARSQSPSELRNIFSTASEDDLAAALEGMDAASRTKLEAAFKLKSSSAPVADEVQSRAPYPLAPKDDEVQVRAPDMSTSSAPVSKDSDQAPRLEKLRSQAKQGLTEATKDGKLANALEKSPSSQMDSSTSTLNKSTSSNISAQPVSSTSTLKTNTKVTPKATRKGAAALMKGLRSGEVSRLVDGMEEQPTQGQVSKTDASKGTEEQQDTATTKIQGELDAKIQQKDENANQALVKIATTADVEAGASTLKLEDVSKLIAGMSLNISGSGNSEMKTIASVSGDSATLDGQLQFAYTRGATIVAKAAGASKSNEEKQDTAKTKIQGGQPLSKVQADGEKQAGVAKENELDAKIQQKDEKANQALVKTATTANVEAGASTLKLEDVSKLIAGMSLNMSGSGNSETKTIASVSGDSITLDGQLQFAYTQGATIVAKAISPQTLPKGAQSESGGAQASNQQRLRAIRDQAVTRLKEALKDGRLASAIAKQGPSSSIMQDKKESAPRKVTWGTEQEEKETVREDSAMQSNYNAKSLDEANTDLQLLKYQTKEGLTKAFQNGSLEKSLDERLQSKKHAAAS